MTERDNQFRDPPGGEPLHPSPLPPELAEFLKTQELVCLTHGSDLGTVLVIKAPYREIRSLRGRVPIQLRHELYDHPQAPVIRMVLAIYDQPSRPLSLESFVNVAAEQQRADYAALAQQKELVLLLYDEALRHRLSKRVRIPRPGEIAQVLEGAERLLAAIPRERLDFDAAKAAVMERVSL